MSCFIRESPHLVLFSYFNFFKPPFFLFISLFELLLNHPIKTIASFTCFNLSQESICFLRISHVTLTLILQGEPSFHLFGFIICVSSTGNKRGYISCGSVLVKGTSTRFSKRTREGTSLMDLWLVKYFTRLKRNLKNSRLLGDWM